MIEQTEIGDMTMSNQTRHNKYSKTITSQDNQSGADQAFTYNILVPEFFMFAVGATAGFATLLTVFS